MNGPGRVCPVRYRYGPATIAEAPERLANTLYVVGGLYGNPQALATIEAMARTESEPATICFNGDFNWFNVDDPGFRSINERVLRHDAIIGNVEAELVEDSNLAGCGCAYPESVDQGIVERSNRIHALLKNTATRQPQLLRRLAVLPMFARYRVGKARVGVVHGDAESLAGWRFDVAALDDERQQDWRVEAFAKADVDIFACTHTCLPAMRSFDIDGTKIVANNGAAGMPNARDTRFGILTRIGTTSSRFPRLYGYRMGGVHVDALAIYYDAAAWEQSFLANWPSGSPAWLSYFERISKGPDFRLDPPSITRRASARVPGSPRRSGRARDSE